MIIMQTLSIGNKKGLVFPVMCNGCIKIDYQDNIPDIGSDADTSNDMPYGIWGHNGSFCFDAIITPYDVNGSGNHTTGTSATTVTNSKKTFPDGEHSSPYTTTSGHYSDKHLPRTHATQAVNRANHKMAIFYSTNLKIYLCNATNDVLHGTYHTVNTNNPASYKLEVQLTTGSTTTTLVSDTLIYPDNIQPSTYTTDILTGGFNRQGRLTHTKIETLGGSAHGGGASFTSGTNPASNKYYLGQELFVKRGFSFKSIGTVAFGSGWPTSSTTTVYLSGTPSSSLNSETIYQQAPKEANYVNNSYHIGVSFDNATRKLSILFNGKSTKTVTHNEDDNDFQLAAEDLYLGANGTNTHATASSIPDHIGYTNSQFYGVFHELSMTTHIYSAFNGKSLYPYHDKTLLFLTFEEVDM